MSSTVIPLLEDLVKRRGDDICDWLRAAYKTAPFFYSSVDVRHSGHKLAPVDTNLFPAGFNNLSKRALANGAEEAKRFFATHYPGARRVLLVPENHTRNLMYLDNLALLSDLIRQAGMEVVIGSLAAEKEPVTLTSQSGAAIVQEPLSRQGDRISAGGFMPDLVLVNNDMTSGEPPLLAGLEQPIIPPTRLGWHRRRKSGHFAAYGKVAREFGEAFGIDPWLINAEFNQCGTVNFKERSGLECVAVNVEKTLHAVRRKYEEYGIKDEPYVFIKADSGTYGMGIMTARSGEELFDMNKKTRNKMDVIKEGVQNTEVLVQEGVPTIDQVEGKPAEPMMYLIGGESIGGAYRVNAARDAYGNLNAPGMEFIGMCDGTGEAAKVKVPDCNFCVFGLVSELAALAATREA